MIFFDLKDSAPNFRADARMHIFSSLPEGHGTHRSFARPGQIIFTFIMYDFCTVLKHDVIEGNDRSLI